QHAIENTPVVSAQADPNDPDFHCNSARTPIVLNQTEQMLSGISYYDELSADQRAQMRRLLMCIADTATEVAKLPETSA
ncbi:anion permease, partial [Proteus mirabilis]|nr:anion permease [Proteus mirabilis]